MSHLLLSSAAHTFGLLSFSYCPTSKWAGSTRSWEGKESKVAREIFHTIRHHGILTGNLTEILAVQICMATQRRRHPSSPQGEDSEHFLPPPEPPSLHLLPAVTRIGADCLGLEIPVRGKGKQPRESSPDGDGKRQTSADAYTGTTAFHSCSASRSDAAPSAHHPGGPTRPR